MALPLDAALPRDAAFVGVPPGEGGVAKISPSKRRKLRDRRVAVRKALVHTTKLNCSLKNICDHVSTPPSLEEYVSAPNVVDRLCNVNVHVKLEELN